MNARVELDTSARRIIITPQNGPPVDLLHDSKRVVKEFFETAIRVAILEKFAQIQSSDTPRRKDMVAIPGVVNQHASLQCLKAKR